MADVRAVGNQGGVADFSADFQVEDVIPVPRVVKSGPRNGPSTAPPRFHKKPRPQQGPAANGSARGSASPAAVAAPGDPADKATAAAAAKAPISDLDPHRLAQRQKQIDYGKNTIGYQRYLEQVPKNKRRKKGEIWLDPVTPDIHQEISKRCFDGQVKVWRRALHKYDLQEDDDKLEPLSYAERQRNRDHAAALLGDSVALSAAPSSPTNSSRSRGSLDGYLEPMQSEGGRKRPFTRAFDGASAPPATAADVQRVPPPAGRTADPPTAPGRAGLPRAASGFGAAAAPAAPQTAPPAATALSAGGLTAGSTAAASPAVVRVRPTRGSRTTDAALQSPGAMAPAAGADELFREWDDEEYAGLDDAELEDVQL
ncbi:hypothetical protein GPECTOR_44g46 [Gonium pectorale]|uniref:Histone RNA hairpin-binding protein RNA-binding domain-containing protein n=1 Tax=Gonium pectorale TaxID=33097 RepID=A0A150G937_GONPE|nr:hypothetical protein GPECTOR_44g46 [Gonium pectorale]|eukprot:KXZ46369.1 hypothetical protein GPECTOR_44g46 [Gonium pectorale]